MESGSPTTNRMFFLDNLRSMIILLVIVFHVAIGYMSPPLQWWYVNDVKTNLFFTVLVMVVDVFIMPAMFLIAGYFTIPVLQRKGFAAFFRHKLTRIALPWLTGVLLFAPAITYMIWFSRSATPPAYLTYLQNTFFTPATFNHAHYWFLGLLFYFYVIIALVYQGNPQSFHAKNNPTEPSASFFALFGLVTTVAFLIPTFYFPADLWFNKLYVVSFQPSRVGICFAYFLLGIYAWRNSWFTSIGYQPPVTRWLLATLTLLIFFTLFRLTTPVPPTLLLKTAHAALHAFFCLGAVFSLLAFFYQNIQYSGWFWRHLADSSYTIYYIHQFIVLPIAYMVQKYDLAVGPKYLLVSAACLILCFYTAELLRMIKTKLYSANR